MFSAVSLNHDSGTNAHDGCAPEHDQLCQTSRKRWAQSSKTTHDTGMPTTSRPLLKTSARCPGADNMTDSNKQKPDYPHRGDNCVKHHEQVANDGVAAGCQDL